MLPEWGARVVGRASGYVLKGGGFRELVSARHNLAAGGAPMSPGIARQVLQQFQQLSLAAPPPPATEGISEREHAVLRGQAYKEIASAMAISAHTVNSHVKNIYEKLHVWGAFASCWHSGGAPAFCRLSA